MNKETKVGLLVGLSFIVLFGVILSNQAPDIVAPPEKPMLSPTAPHRTPAQVIRQIETAAPAPEPIDLVVDAAGEQAGTTDAASDARPAAAAAANASATAKPDAKPTDTTTLTASNGGDATKTITADNLGPETAEAEPGDDGMEMISSRVDSDGTQTKVYVVKSGDCLAKISRQFYGDATNRNIDKIFEANKDKMPNKKTLKVGIPIHVPVKVVTEKDKTADDLLSSGKFDEVAELKPASQVKDAFAAKETASAKDAKETKPAPETKETPKPAAKDARKSPARTAVAEVSREALEDILLKRTAPEQPAQTTTASNELARVVEPVDATAEKTAAEKTDAQKLAKELDKVALASRENCKRYQIQKGDTWYKLAAKFMGDSKRWHDLYALNDDILPDATKLRTGVRIRVPAGKSRLDSVVE